MKRIISVILIIVFCVSLASCSDNDKSTTTDLQSKSASIETKKADFVIGRNADYVSTSVPDLYKGADLVIVGNYVKDKSTYVFENSLIVTKSEFNVKEIKKGSYDKSQIVIDYYGGEMSIGKYMEKLDKETLKKSGYDKLTESEKKEKKIKMEGLQAFANPNKTSDFLIFLSFSKEKNMYFVMSDGYGMREMKNAKAFNVDTKSYEEVKFE
jgi:hypothetical protein